MSDLAWLEVKDVLESEKELYESTIKLYKNSMRMEIFLIVTAWIVAIMVMVLGIRYAVKGDWLYSVLEFVLVLMYFGLGGFSLQRFVADKRKVDGCREKLDRVNFDLDLLESDGV